MTATGPFTELDARRLGPVRRLFFLHPRVSDVLVLLLVGVPGVLDAALGGRTTSTPTSVALALVGTAALWWRRAHPIPVAGVVTASMALGYSLTGTPGGMDVGLAFALYAVAASRPPRASWITAGVTSLVAVGAIWAGTAPLPQATRPPDGQIVLSDTRWGGSTGNHKS